MLFFTLFWIFPAHAAPTCGFQIVTPARGATVSGAVQVVVAQPDDSVEWINLWVDHDYIASSPPYTFTWDSTRYSKGTHRIRATAWTADNRLLCYTVTEVTVVNPPVTVVLPSTGDIVAGTIRVTTKVTQEVDWVNLEVDGEYVDSPDYEFGFDTTQLPDGPHTISVVAMQDPETVLGKSSIAVDVANHGRVLSLIAGGYQGARIFDQSETYDPVTRLFTAAASMQSPRSSHSATRLLDGRVLMAGGFRNSQDELTNSAELFDPVAGNFTPTGTLGTSRFNHTATLLAGGKVLVAGGTDQDFNIVASAELFDPLEGIFSLTGSMVAARTAHESVLLPNQTVLVTGGIDDQGVPTASAEIYDASLGIFTGTGSMLTARVLHTMTVLGTNQVLVTGGADNTAELYDPGLGQFAPTGTMTSARQLHTATLLASGKVLIAGGIDDTNQVSATAELYDPVSGTFAPTGMMTSRRAGQNAILQIDGTVLMVGGGATGAEVYDPDSETFEPVDAPIYAPSGGQQSVLVHATQ